MGRLWAMVDSGSEPTVADAKKHFPGHAVVPSKHQGRKYSCANGSEIVNAGQVHITHRDVKHGDFEFTCENAPVHCPILSVRQLVEVGCSVTFKGKGGYINIQRWQNPPFHYQGLRILHRMTCCAAWDN